MALLRPSMRPATSLSRHCTRSLSCTSRRLADPPRTNIAAETLRILHGSSSSSSAPKRPAPRKTVTLTPKDVQDAELSAKRTDYEQQLARKFKPGDVYAPHDLTGQEMQKWKKSRNAPKTDAIDALGLNPINEYKNFSMMSEFMTEMGRIKSAQETGLRPVNQRRMAKAIRRAIGVGLMPSVHKHPELLMKQHKPIR
ncbi:ribosomal protein S18 [Mytilinidion resinicola]|uniref:Small ribosomal subunit protein bS18m n=1 Tax=Mytilinidion resinicola TaxID=574789 RepID=A0A6A6YGA0_9PEZI|nr:ribosomal protein S18 [Mytilinidion resinicola]KAF2807846.1 ribosomal protein S18 [Mytilinidion resinicola]